jgi:hypothetical protein
VLTRARRLAVTLTAAGAIVAGTALPAAAQEVTTTSRERVLGDLQHEKIRVRLGDGSTARGDVLRFREDDGDLDLRPRLAQRQVHGLQRMDSMARQEVGRGAIAGTNGGYWISRRSGNPNGLHVQHGRLTGTNASAQGGGIRYRSALGIEPSGRLQLGQVETEQRYYLPDGTIVRATYMNRRVHANGDVVFYDDQYGDSIHVPPGAVFVQTDGLEPASGGTTAGTVRRVEAPDVDRYFTLASGQSAVVANISAPDATQRGLRRLRTGDTVSLNTRVISRTNGERWPRDLTGALPAGGTLLRGGQIPSLSEWTGEAFSSGQFTGRHPRTAIGRTPGGEVLLVTIDGRRSGWSVGMTGRELAVTLSRLGARDAVNLDGGGSTTMTRGGSIVNRPSETGRSVASGLFVHAPTPPDARSLNAACPSGQVPSAGFTDTASSVHAASIDCLAWWDVTQGTGRNRYSPSSSVTRAQMASFLARFIDHAAERGDANGLPAEAPNTFSDVHPDNPHATAIARLADADIVQGRGDGTYNPSGRVTRDQMASFIRRALEHASGRSLPAARDTFMDDNGLVHEQSIDRLAGIGVASGVGGFDYRPRANIRRDAMASLLMRGADYLVTEGLTTPPS